MWVSGIGCTLSQNHATHTAAVQMCWLCGFIHWWKSGQWLCTCHRANVRLWIAQWKTLPMLPVEEAGILTLDRQCMSDINLKTSLLSLHSDHSKMERGLQWIMFQREFYTRHVCCMLSIYRQLICTMCSMCWCIQLVCDIPVHCLSMQFCQPTLKMMVGPRWMSLNVNFGYTF